MEILAKGDSNTPGNKAVYDALGWSSQAEYQAESFVPWFWVNDSEMSVKGGDMKGVEGLWFFSVDGAGHTCPGDQKEAVVSVVNAFISGKGEMRELSTNVYQNSSRTVDF